MNEILFYERNILKMKDIIHIYVSPFGCDSADGSKEHPLRTLEAAKNHLRIAAKRNGAVVTLLEGRYDISNTVVFTEEDSGRDGAPIVYEAEGKVLLSGAKTISHDKIKPIEDEDAIRRITAINKIDVSKVLEADLSDIGLDMEFGIDVHSPRFFAGESEYICARYPNKEHIPGRDGNYIWTSHVNYVPENDNHIDLYCEGEEVKAHISAWDEKAYSTMSIYGYLWNQWTDIHYYGVSGNKETGVITARIPGRGYAQPGDSTGTQRRVAVLNVLEELDEKGEYFYDKSKKKLFFIPNDDFNADTDVFVSYEMKNCLSICGAKNITFKGISVKYYRDNIITVDHAENIRFENCTIANGSNQGARVTFSSNVVFDSCDVYDLADGGIYYIDCGSRYDLIDAGALVENCFIHDVSQINRCYRPTVGFKNSCGLIVRGCTLKNAAHLLVLFEHVNDVIVEDCRIENGCLDTDDASGIYWGRDPSDLGIVIRNNYFRNFGNNEATFNTAAIYIDDMATSAEIYNNIFFDCGRLTDAKMTMHTNANAIVLNTAQFLKAYNNILVGTYPDQKPTNLYPVHFLAKYILIINGIFPEASAGHEDGWYHTLSVAGFFTDTWKQHYKNTTWALMWDLVSPEKRQKWLDYINAGGEAEKDKRFVDVAWDVLDKIWDHVGYDGKLYNGTLRDHFREAAPTDNLAADLLSFGYDFGNDNSKLIKQIEENATPIGNSDIDSHLFWSAVTFRLKFRTTDTFVNNLSVGMNRAYLTEDGKLKGNVMNGFQQNYNPLTDKLANGDSMFVEYGKDFELTEEGLHEVNKYLPEFHNVSMKGLGAKR